MRNLSLFAELSDLGRGKVEVAAAGVGAVSPSERDPKRVWAKSEKNEALERRGSKCESCEPPLEIDDAVGHHLEWHADGGRTDDGNLAVP